MRRSNSSSSSASIIISPDSTILHKGVAAFERGDGDEARRLIEEAIGQGAPSDEALAVLDRLDRLEQGAPSERQINAPRSGRSEVQSAAGPKGAGVAVRVVTWVAVIVLIGAAGGMAVLSSHPDWRSLLVLEREPVSAAPVPELVLPLPTRGEDLLAQARRLAAGGHLREALASLDLIRLTDSQRGDADRLRGAIQKQLIDLAAPAQTPGEAHQP